MWEQSLAHFWLRYFSSNEKSPMKCHVTSWTKILDFWLVRDLLCGGESSLDFFLCSKTRFNDGEHNINQSRLLWVKAPSREFGNSKSIRPAVTKCFFPLQRMEILRENFASSGEGESTYFCGTPMSQMSDK